MNEEIRHLLTFAILDRDKGFAELPPITSMEYPLPAWYRAVREIPLEELSVEDICKACRQQIHLEHVVPIALRILQSQPLAGEMYDGELLVSLKYVPLAYWQHHKTEAMMLNSVCEIVCQQESLSDEVSKDVVVLLKGLK